ncbi:hypothetical protein [Halobacillus amylolyticus]|uniref:Uncharacterized protein n=1 Tax=Halobacillus amylolyticus TaxID=2932259 RepID=A0ABY4HGX4_9BACI|nr:hypothetical protein [Halobacillus amylolyticus]UOR13633.1 hypothetical protein MUO15_09390 [Halobacillus amylolyticus]
MQFGFGYREYINGKHQITIIEHFPKAEYDKHIKNIEFMRYYVRLKQIFTLAESNSNSFLQYMASVKKGNAKSNDESAVLEGNRLLINYLTSAGMFIDYGEKELGKALGKKYRIDFQKETSRLYDSIISYRFMDLMRNYAVHYGFPLHTYVRSLKAPSGLFSTKNALLQFKKWKHVRSDIERMPDNIRLEPHVEFMQMCIKHLFEKCIYDFSAKLVEVIEYTDTLVKKAEKKPPVFIKFESEEKYRVGEFTAMPVDIGIIQEALTDLRNHPSITITDKENRRPETQLEFYFNDELIMSGSVSDFKRIVTNQDSTEDVDPILSLGDRFALDDFPKMGQSTKVRVIKMQSNMKQSNGFPDTIKYYLEKYPQENTPST